MTAASGFACASLEDVEPVEAREDDVGDDDVELLRLDAGQGLLAAAGGGDLVASETERQPSASCILGSSSTTRMDGVSSHALVIGPPSRGPWYVARVAAVELQGNRQANRATPANLALGRAVPATHHGCASRTVRARTTGPYAGRLSPEKHRRAFARVRTRRALSPRFSGR